MSECPNFKQDPTVIVDDMVGWHPSYKDTHCQSVSQGGRIAESIAKPLFLPGEELWMVDLIGKKTVMVLLCLISV